MLECFTESLTSLPYKGAPADVLAREKAIEETVESGVLGGSVKSKSSDKH